MSRRLPIALALALAVLISGTAVCPAALPPSLEPFLRQEGLAEVFRYRPLTQVMTKRWEAVASHDGYLYGLVAYNDKNHPSKTGLMASFCRLAILRDKMKPLEARVSQKTQDALLVAEVLRLAVLECRIRRFQTLGLDHLAGWSVCACRVRPEDITLPNPLPRVEDYLAQAAYNLGKEALNRDDEAVALEWFKQTRINLAVYHNSLAYLVPLIHSLDKDLSARVDRMYLNLAKVNDPEALAYLTRFRLTGRQLKAAEQTCRRCLELDSDNEECAGLLNELNQARMKEGLAYENFFPNPDRPIRSRPSFPPVGGHLGM